MAREKFVYNMPPASYEKEWGSQYEKPGCWAKTPAFFFRIIPKVGPFKALAFRTPTQETDLIAVGSI